MNTPISTASPALQVTTKGRAASTSPPLVFLHGWASCSQVWAMLYPLLVDQYEIILIDLPGFGINSTQTFSDKNDLFDRIENVLPTQCHIIGWSLGGMIAAELVARNPKQFLSLTSIAANLKFSASRDWPHACPQDTVKNFCTAFDTNPRACIKKFTQLQAYGDSEYQQCTRFLKQHATPLAFDEDPIREKWRSALSMLTMLDGREYVGKLSLPRLAILGEHDHLVPSAVAHTLVQKRYFSRTEIIAGAGHLPHVTQAEKVADLIRAHVTRGDRKLYTREKKKLADSFSRAARHYDKVAALQRRVASRLMAMRGDISGVVCDLGCGTGFCGEKIDHSACDLVGLDIAFGMLKNCQEKHLYQQKNLICADFDKLPLAEGVFDGVVSSMSLQWSEDLPWSLSEIRRILKPAAKSWLLFSTLGPHTLHELRSSWQRVDRYVHVNNFESLLAVEKSLRDTGFRIVRQKTEMEELRYDSVMALMRDLKSIGAHNINAGNKSSLTTRRQLLALNDAYEHYRKGDSLPASYEVFYFLVELTS